MHEHIGALILSRRIIWAAVIRPCRICVRASCDIMNLTQGSHEQTILHWCNPQVVAEPTPILCVIGQDDSTLLTVKNFGNKQRDTSQNGLFSLQHAECLPSAFLLCPSTKILPDRVNGGLPSVLHDEPIEISTKRACSGNRQWAKPPPSLLHLYRSCSWRSKS